MMRLGYASRAAALALALGMLGAGAAAAQEGNRLYLTVDKTQVISFRSSTISKIAVTNPAIADVNVISPTQLLVNGKTPGVTSLLVFYPDRIDHFDVIVHPAPIAQPRAALVPSQEHVVEVQRAGQVSQQLFVPDTDHGWVQLGGSKAEPEAIKK